MTRDEAIALLEKWAAAFERRSYDAVSWRESHGLRDQILDAMTTSKPAGELDPKEPQ